MRVTHPFHPLAGREFDLVVRKNNWAEDRVFFFVAEGQMCSVPAGWTDVDPGDPFVVVAAGRSAFRVDDLVSLASLIEGLRTTLGEKV
ncbi:MAG: Y4bD/Y4pK family protein [Actinomycetota bacterium]|nr:Y4bD/Y4pK family protein [Actinomycetota bacterium]